MVSQHQSGESARVTHLFMLRLWPEDLGGGRVDWRGSIRHVNSGEARYFRDWPTVEEFVRGLLRNGDPGTRRPGGQADTGELPRAP